MIVRDEPRASRATRVPLSPLAFALVVALVFPAFALPPAVATSPWDTTVRVSLDGAAGEWVLFYHDLPQPMPRTIYEHWESNFNVTGEGEPFEVITSLPTPTMLVQGCCNLSRPYPRFGAPSSVDPSYLLSSLRAEKIDGSSYSKGWSIPIGIIDATNITRSTVFVAGATAPWHLDVTFQLTTLEDAPQDPHATVGSLAQPSYLHVGRGMTFQRYTEKPVALPALPSGYTAGSIDGSFAVGALGWTHVQYDWTNPLDATFGLNWENPAKSSWAYRTGTHQIDFRFPNGYRYVMTPASTDTGVGPLTWPYPLREAGAQDDVPGELRVHAFRFDNSTNVSLTVVHMPIRPDEWPADLQRWNYQCHQLEPAWRDPMGGNPVDCKEPYVSSAPDVDDAVG